MANNNMQACKRSDKRVARTERAIEAAFESLLFEQAYASMTISGIARRAGIDRKTFYLHYASIDALLRSLLDELVLSVMNAYLAAEAEEDPLERSVDTSVKRCYRVIDEVLDRKRNLYMLIAQKLPYGVIFERIKEPLMREILSRGLMPSANPSGELFDCCVSYVLGGTLELYVSWFKAGADPEKRVTSIAATFTSGGIERLIKQMTDGTGIER